MARRGRPRKLEPEEVSKSVYDRVASVLQGAKIPLMVGDIHNAIGGGVTLAEVSAVLSDMLTDAVAVTLEGYWALCDTAAALFLEPAGAEESAAPGAEAVEPKVRMRLVRVPAPIADMLELAPPVFRPWEGKPRVVYSIGTLMDVYWPDPVEGDSA